MLKYRTQSAKPEAKKTAVVFFAVLFLTAAPAIPFAENQEQTGTPWKLSAVTDFAYYPKTDYVSGGSHFAPVTGLFSGVQLRTAVQVKYSVPAADRLIAKDALVLGGALSVSPVSVTPKLSVSCTPLPFLSFSAGTAAGTGWSCIGLHGMAGYNSSRRSYESLDPFKSWYSKSWISGTLMFDAAALWPGDWHHIVAAVSGELHYTQLSNKDGSTIWEWETTKGLSDGWQYYVSCIAGYQMPMLLSFAGIQLEFRGHLSGDDYSGIYRDYNGSFMQIDISPTFQLAFSKKDSMYILCNFSSRRSFTEDHTETEEEPLLSYSGREYLFYRLAFSWTHKFQ